MLSKINIAAQAIYFYFRELREEVFSRGIALFLLQFNFWYVIASAELLFLGILVFKILLL